MGLSRGERDQQSQSISIAPLRVNRQVAFPDEMFQEKAAYPRAESGSHTLLRYVKRGWFINLLRDLSRGERDQQSESISIAPLRVNRQVAFPDEMLSLC